MVRSLLKLVALLVAGILIYNYFFGTDTEKDNSRKIFGQVRDVVVSVGHLVKTEKQKFDAGKYDVALEKLGGVYKAVRSQAQHLDASFIKRLDELEQRKASLQQQLDTIEQQEPAATEPLATGKKKAKADPKAEQAKTMKAADQQRRKEELQRQLDELLKDSDEMLKQAQEQ
ncbi:MAG: hypothetical protein KA165_19110 [Saprospiraceae bacterium]|nr:hypothetical protein [Saprospiraceae bacterium]